ncbi:NUDIX domain-containing protein [Mesobacillus subterraneus]|uniref:NUDIX domain-containing protein n=1 Tax=Mesobacillus subterraneus TaxID=285983 RepID=A0A3R9EZ82_9BACI|nr:NUDIX domain-containing protein [Mesobacillus subterraneus]RSD25540.1 NUDIX domain-containing protein [Mesobacillus subterraneus]
MVTTQNNGFEFMELLKISEQDIKQYSPLAGSFALLEMDGKYLLCYNSLRKQWELPAGKREKGETPLECAKRELYEETGKISLNLHFMGLLKVKNLLSGTFKYNPIYYSRVNFLEPFHENNETTKILLWDLIEDIHIDQVDLAILMQLKKNHSH